MTDTVDLTVTTDADDDTPRPITFDADRLPRLDEELARLNKIATKLNVEHLSYTELARGIRTGERLDPFSYRPIKFEVETVTVLINGASPRLPGGWKFLGSVEFLPPAEDGSDMALVHGDDERLAGYRDAGPNCDHCGFKRNRKKVVVLVDEADTLTVVGSTCLKDFLGYHGDPEKVTWFAESVADMMSDLDDEGGGGMFGRAPDDVPTDVFVALAAATVRVFGWTAKSSYSGIPTASRIDDILYPPKRDKHNADYLDELATVKVTDDDESKGKAVRVWAITAADERPLDNYLGNLKVVLSGSWTLRKHFGIAASAVGSYDRALGFEIKREAEKKAGAESEWVGTVGKREVFTGTVASVTPYETMYGTGKAVKLLDGDGNILKSLTSGAWAYGLEVGDVVTVKATVKEHGEWRGAKETNLTRAALVSNSKANTEDTVPCGDPVKHAHWACDCPDEKEGT